MILHNLLIGDPCPAEWRDEVDADEFLALENDDNLQGAVPLDAPKGERHRQLHHFLQEARVYAASLL